MTSVSTSASSAQSAVTVTISAKRAWRTSRKRAKLMALEPAFWHAQHVVGLEPVGAAYRVVIDLAVGAAPLDADAALGAALRQAAADRQRLHHRHVRGERVGARRLDLAVDVDQGQRRHEHGVAGTDHDVLVRGAADLDLLAEVDFLLVSTLASVRAVDHGDGGAALVGDAAS